MLRRFGFVLVAILVSSCALPTKFPLMGALYTGVQQPVTATAQLSMKRGEACASHILGLVATGDASIEAARKAGGIRSISTVDENVSSFLLGAYATVCTVVYGK